MRPWMTHWRDWAMNELLPLPRLRMRPQALHVSYEKAGLTLPGPKIPWCAEVVVVEATLKLPHSARRKSDFSLRLPNHDAIEPECLQVEREDQSRLSFRFSPPTQHAMATLSWKQHL